MRKRFAVILVFVFVGIGCCLPSNASMADSNPEINDDDVPEAGSDSNSENSVSGGNAATTSYAEETVSGNDAADIPNDEYFSGGNAVTTPYVEETVSGNDAVTTPYVEETVSGNNAAGIPNDEYSVSGEDVEIVSLQIPERVSIVVDPFEIDGNGQIYSEQYVVRNVGRTAGVLTLSNVIRIPGEQDEVTVRTETEGLHSGREKSIYMEMVFGNGDKVVFTQEGSVYEVELEPGEELVLWFAGEVNENVSQPWWGGDIAVMINYMWDAKEEDMYTGRSGEQDFGLDISKEEQVSAEDESWRKPLGTESEDGQESSQRATGNSEAVGSALDSGKQGEEEVLPDVEGEDAEKSNFDNEDRNAESITSSNENWNIGESVFGNEYCQGEETLVEDSTGGKEAAGQDLDIEH